MITKNLSLSFISLILLAFPYPLVADEGRDRLDLPVDLSVQGDCSVGKDLSIQGQVKLKKFPKEGIPACDAAHEGVLIYAEEKANGKGEGYLFLCTHADSDHSSVPRWVKITDRGATPYEN